MPSYDKKDFKESNVNYLNKDFNSFKQSLVQYAQSYFPNTYRDFNETSPGMMLIEMAAYVGDVTSFYIDQQYKEMLLPLAEERRNVMNMAKMFGYKVKPVIPAHVDLNFTQVVPSVIGDESKVDYSNELNGAAVFAKGIKIQSSANTNVIFETLDTVDFTMTGSNDTESPAGVDSNTGLVSNYTLTRTVKAVSGETKTKRFNITAPEKFKKITIPDTNVIDIISCRDSNGNDWYEVDFLAQDKVAIATHYTQDDNRDNAYRNLDNTQFEAAVPVPYSLRYMRTQKRFTRETNLDNTTSLVFGNGILKDGTTLDDGFIDLEQLGIIIPGQTNDLEAAIDPMLGDEYSTLGETPAHTTLTITYRVGGGLESNVASGDLATMTTTPKKLSGGTNASISTVTNPGPARGGKGEETIEEIREKTKAFFTTQNRCVTKEDYEARIMNLPSKFGGIAKAYVKRNPGEVIPPPSFSTESITSIMNSINTTYNQLIALNTFYQNTIDAIAAENPTQVSSNIGSGVQSIETAKGIIENMTIAKLDTQGSLMSEALLSMQDDMFMDMELMHLSDLNQIFIDMADFASSNSQIHPEKLNEFALELANRTGKIEDWFNQLKQKVTTVNNEMQEATNAYTMEESARDRLEDGINTINSMRNILSQNVTQIQNIIETFNNPQDENLETLEFHTEAINNYGLQIGSHIDSLHEYNFEAQEGFFELPSVTVFILSYDNGKNLIGNPNADQIGAIDNIPLLLKQNIKNYMDNFKILTDQLTIQDGYVINFGVFFDVVSHKYADKQQVKVRCIQRIIDYFKIENMQFSHPIFVSQLEYELMGLEGVRAVNYVRLSQYENRDPISFQVLDQLPQRTFKYSVQGDGTILTDGTANYGYSYNFEEALTDGVILPPSPDNPGVFELKFPNQNVKGVVR